MGRGVYALNALSLVSTLLARAWRSKTVQEELRYPCSILFVLFVVALLHPIQHHDDVCITSSSTARNETMDLYLNCTRRKRCR